VNATLRLGTPVCVLAAELYELVTIDAGVRGHQYASRRSVAARAIATAATPRPALARRHPATAQPSAGVRAPHRVAISLLVVSKPSA
jgi:hypothetical protein